MPAAVVTYRFWQRALGGDPSVLNRVMAINGATFTIVGVGAPGFYGMSKGGPFFKPSDVLLPLAMQPLVYTRSNAAFAVRPGRSLPVTNRSVSSARWP